MTKEPAKDFGAIADDYAFFESHATEAEADVRAYATHLSGISPDGETVRMLDFGCGSGSFTARFLEQVGWPPERLKLTLVEPAESVRAGSRTFETFHDHSDIGLGHVAGGAVRMLRSRPRESRLLLRARSRRYLAATDQFA